MLKEIKDYFFLMASLLSVFGAVAVMISDIYQIDLQRLITIAATLSIVLACIPFLNRSVKRKE